MYEMEIDYDKKAFIIKISGFFKEDDVIQYIDEYYKKLKYIDPSKFSLVLIADDLAASSQYMLPKLESVVNIYKSTGFKNVFSTYPKSFLARIQIEKLSDLCGFNVSFKSSLEEIIKELK